MTGINELLYGKPNKIMLTQKDVMNNLHIKDRRTFIKLISEDNLPYIKVGKKYVVPLDKFNQWIEDKTIGG